MTRFEVVAAAPGTVRVVFRNGDRTTRAVPGAELDAHVDRIARRIASSDPVAVSEAERLIRRGARDERAAIEETIAALPAVAVRTAGRRRELAARATAEGPALEPHLGERLGR